MLGAARNMGNTALKSAQNAGMNFLNEAVKNGLIEDLINQNFDGIANKAKKQVMDKVTKGMETLKNLSSKAQEFGNKLVKNAKTMGEDLLKKGKGAVDDIVKQGKGIVQQGKDMVDQNGKKINDQAKAYQDVLNQKTGQISNGIGSLLARTFDGGNGMFTKVGQKLGGLAGGGLNGLTGSGEDTLKRLTGGMQNLLPSGLGGSLQSGMDKMKSMIPGKGSSIIGDFTKGGFGGLGGLQDKVKNMIPTGGLTLENGKKFTEKFLKMPEGVRLPSSLSGFKDKLPGLDKLPAMGGYADKIKNVGGNLAQRGDIGTYADKLRENFNVDPNKWLNKAPKFQLPKPNIPLPLPKSVGRRRRKRQAAGMEAGLDAEHSEGQTTSKNKQSGSEHYDSHSSSERMFSDVSKSKSLMESFKSTTGLTNTMTTSDFVQSSQAITKKEVVDVKVSGVPPKRKIVISQLMFECDGNIIKLPKIYFHDGKEVIQGLAESVMGNKVQSIGGNNAVKHPNDTMITDNSAMASTTVSSTSNATSLNETLDHKNAEMQQRSLISKLLHDDYNEKWDNMALADRVVHDPSMLYDDEEHAN